MPLMKPNVASEPAPSIFGKLPPPTNVATVPGSVESAESNVTTRISPLPGPAPIWSPTYRMLPATTTPDGTLKVAALPKPSAEPAPVPPVLPPPATDDTTWSNPSATVTARMRLNEPSARKTTPPGREVPCGIRNDGPCGLPKVAVEPIPSVYGPQPPAMVRVSLKAGAFSTTKMPRKRQLPLSATSARRAREERRVRYVFAEPRLRPPHASLPHTNCWGSSVSQM